MWLDELAEFAGKIVIFDTRCVGGFLLIGAHLKHQYSGRILDDLGDIFHGEMWPSEKKH